MKKFTKTVSVILAVLMAASMFAALPFTASAAETPEETVGNLYYGTTGGCYWELNTENLIMTVGFRSDTNCKMADYVSDNQPWRAYSNWIYNVKIEDGVKHIGDYSFFNSKNLITLSIGNAVESIGYSAFAGCNLSYVEIPASVTEIYDRAFNSNPNMEFVTIPPTVTYIGARSFGYIDDQKVEGFKVYGYKGSKAENYASVNGFEFVEIGAYNGTTGDCTWKFDTKTNTLTVSGSGAMADYYWSDHDHVSTVPWWDYRDQITSVVIGDSVTRVGDFAFKECNNLMRVTLGKRLNSIGEGAFDSCDLIAVDLPLSLHTIEKSAFANNAALVSVDLKGNLEAIGRYAFSECSIYNLTLPESLKSVGFSAFINNAFKTVVIPKSVTYIEEYAFGFESAMKIIENFTIYGWSDTAAETYARDSGIRFEPYDGRTGTCTWEYDPKTGTLTIGGNGGMDDYMIELPPWFGFRDYITTVIIGDEVVYVGKYSFLGMYNMTDLKIGSGVMSVGSYAFFDCDMTDVTIPDNVTNIGDEAFGYKLASPNDIPIEGFTVYGYDGSTAERYAVENGFTFVPLDSPVSDSVFVITGSSNWLNSWSPAIDEYVMMKNSDGTYEITIPDVPATKTNENYAVKVVEYVGGDEHDQKWHGMDGTSLNYEFRVLSRGDVTVTYDPESGEITVTGPTVADPAYDIEFITAVGNGRGNWLNGASWEPDNRSNRMTEVSDGVYEIVYKDVPSGSNYAVKFAANGGWDINWGTRELIMSFGTPMPADYDAGNIGFGIDETTDVTLRLDLTKMDWLKKTGAKFTITLGSTPDTIIGDVNGDNAIDILDAIMIQKYAVEKISIFPKEAFLEG